MYRLNCFCVHFSGQGQPRACEPITTTQLQNFFIILRGHFVPTKRRLPNSPRFPPQEPPFYFEPFSVPHVSGIRRFVLS